MLVLTGGPRDVRELWFSPDGRGLTAGNWDGDTRAWRLDAPAEPPSRSADAAPPPAVSVVYVRRMSECYQLPGGALAAVGRRVCSLATEVLADGKRFVAAERTYDGSAWWLSVRSLADGAELARLPFRQTSAATLRAVPASARVVGTAGGRLLVWDCDASTCDEVPGRGRKLWTDLAAHPSGQVVAAVNNAPHVTLLDPHAATVAGTFDPGVGQLTSAACSPDGLLWAVAGATGRVAVWDADG